MEFRFILATDYYKTLQNCEKKIHAELIFGFGVLEILKLYQTGALKLHFRYPDRIEF